MEGRVGVGFMFMKRFKRYLSVFFGHAVVFPCEENAARHSGLLFSTTVKSLARKPSVTVLRKYSSTSSNISNF